MHRLKREPCTAATLRRLGFGLLILLSANCVMGQRARAYDLMLDVSGSMEGFRQAGDASWNGVISSLEAEAERLWSFGSRVTVVEGSLTAITLDQETTRLGDALKEWLDTSRESDALVIITDNVADEGLGEATENQEKFYRLLTRSRTLDHIAVAPFRLPFKGWVYHPNDDTRRSWYEGPRALAIYLITRADFDEAGLDSLRDRLLTVLARAGAEDTDPVYIQIRPFAKEGWTQGAAKTDLNIGAIGARATRIRIGEEGIALLGFDVGEELDFTIDATVRPGPDFRLVDAALLPTIRFDDLPFLNRAKVLDVAVTPRKATLEPEYEQPFVIDFRIRGFALTDLDFWTRFKLALKGTTWASGELSISYQVERRNISLAGEVSEDWDYSGDINRLATPDPEVQSRIYRLNTLIQRMIPNSELQKQIWVRPVWVQLAYPVSPILFLMVLIIVVIVFLVLAAVWLAQSGADYVVIDDAGTMHRIKAPFGNSVVIPSSDNLTHVRIRNFGFFHLHSTSARLRSPRMASTSRAVAIVESEDEDAEQYRFTIESAKAGSTIGDRNEDRI